MGDARLNINLIPWRDQKKFQQTRLFYLIIIILNCLIFLIALNIREKYIHQTKQIKLATSDYKMENLSVSKAILNTKKQINQLQNYITVKQKISNKLKDQYKKLYSLAENLPINTTLQSITLTNKQIIIQGKTSNINQIHQYVRELLKTKSFKSILLNNLSFDHNNAINFKLNSL